MSTRNAALEFVDLAAERIRAGRAIAGAIHEQGGGSRSTGLEGLACPWCGTLVIVLVFAADHADTGEFASGVWCGPNCRHGLAIRHLWRKAKSQVGVEGEGSG